MLRSRSDFGRSSSPALKLSASTVPSRSPAPSISIKTATQQNLLFPPCKDAVPVNQNASHDSQVDGRPQVPANRRDWVASMSLGFRPGYNGFRTKHFPRSNTFPLPKSVKVPKPVADVPAARSALLAAEQSKAASNNNTGKRELEWKDVCSILQREKATLLQFDVRDAEGGRDGRAKELIAWVVSESGKVLAHEVTEVISVLDGPGERLDGITKDMEDSLRMLGKTVLRKLYNLCIRPVEDCLPRNADLLIVPQAYLCFVPWAALMNNFGTYLLENHAIRVVPSLAMLAEMAENTRRGLLQRGLRGGPRGVVVENPLPISERFSDGTEDDGELLHAESEAGEVVAALEHRGVQVERLARQAATKERVLEAMRGASWVHVVAHVEGQVLLLARDDGAGGGGGGAGGGGGKAGQGGGRGTDDGLLGAEEVRERLRVAPGCAVILSACNACKSATEMFGLCEALARAGAGSVLVSMWSLLDESTSSLMRRMYRYLLNGAALPSALQSAMLQLSGRRYGDVLDPWDSPDTPYCMLPYSRPLNWAGLIVVGPATALPAARAPSPARQALLPNGLPAFGAGPPCDAL